MSKLIFFLLTAMLFLQLLPAAEAVGISGPKPRFIFEPGLDMNITYIAINSAAETLNISIALEVDSNFCCADAAEEDGKILQTATITPISVSLDPAAQGQFNVHIKLPNEIKVPGQHAFLVRATEVRAAGAGLSASASVRTPIYLFVRFPGKHMDVSLQGPDVEAEGMQTFSVQASNRGTLGIDRLYATINVFDAQNRSVAMLETDEQSLPIDRTAVLEAIWNTTGQSEGLYYAVADVNYDGLAKQAKDSFRIGVLNLIIINYTRQVFAGLINPFDLEVESRWNSVIDGVYAIVNVKKEGKLVATFQTPTTKVDPWSRGNVSGFFNANIPPDSYDMDINLNFAGKSTSARDVLTVVEKGLLTRDILIPIAIFAILLAINLALWFFIWRRRSKGPPNQ